MKPFNLKEALEGKSVVTRCGLPVLELYLFKELPKEQKCLIANVDEVLQFYHNSGMYVSDSVESGLDLFMFEEKKTIWINIWKTKTGYIFTTDHLSEDRADRAIENELFATHIKKITTEI